jgi:hypothetical protein
VLVLTLFLFMGQQTLFASPGIAYADYTLMALFTVASVFVLARIVNGADLSRRDAAMLGALFWLSVRAKETALPLACLGALLLITPSGRMRDRREALRVAVACIAGVAAAMLGLMILDALLLGDPLFSVRVQTWRELLGYNTRPFEYHAPEHGWLGLLLQPENFVSFAVYLGAGLLWSGRERDRRLLVLYALPALFVLQLLVSGTFAVVTVTPRYVVAILPMVSFLAAFAYLRVVQDAGGTRAVLTPRTLVAAIAVLLAMGFALTLIRPATTAEALRGSLAPTLIVTAFVALLFVRWLPRLAAAVATLAILVSGTFPLVRVVEDLATRRAQREGEARFAGFYQVARAVRADRNAVVFVSRNLYGGAIRPGVTADVTRMNFNVPFRSRPIVDAPWPAPPHADFAVVSFDEYQQWLAGPQGDRERALISDDREVALICLRAPCPLR